ncbi:hypothetical protein TNCV_1033531 [Trichonephila clavipes]|nr:hypothetical protein TNCV_1033531 [Trichonephila clavipes]
MLTAKYLNGKNVGLWRGRHAQEDIPSIKVASQLFVPPYGDVVDLRCGDLLSQRTNGVRTKTEDARYRPATLAN